MQQRKNLDEHSTTQHQRELLVQRDRERWGLVLSYPTHSALDFSSYGTSQQNMPTRPPRNPPRSRHSDSNSARSPLDFIRSHVSTQRYATFYMPRNQIHEQHQLHNRIMQPPSMIARSVSQRPSNHQE